MRENSIRPVPHLALLAILTTITLVAYAHWVTGGANNKGWELQAARLLLEGKRLAVDIFEVNPPLIFWLFTLPVSLSHVAAIADYHMLVIWALCLISLSIAVSLRLIKLSALQTDSYIRPLNTSLLLGTILIVFASASVFGDREHTFMILTLPYILRQSPSLSSVVLPRGLSLIVGLMGGVGFCIKPHCLLLFAAIQLSSWLRRHNLSCLYALESLVIYAIGIIYLGAVYYYVPEYVFTVLPMALATYGSAGGRINLILYLALPFITLCIAGADFRIRPSSPYRQDISYFLTLTAGALAYALANNGWDYTVYPFTVTTTLTVALLWCEFLWLRNNADQRIRQRAIYGARACLIALAGNSVLSVLIASLVFPSVAMFVYPKPDELKQTQICSNAYAAAIRATHSRTFGAIPSDFLPLVPLMREENAHFETRFYQLWMLYIFPRKDAAFRKEHEYILRFVAQALAEDMEKNHPEIMMAEVDAKTGTPYFIPYLSNYPEFTAAWNHYTETDGSRSLHRNDMHLQKSACGYRIYSRTPQ